MAGQLTSKVRLVKCPGCWGILTELAPVYECAACGKVLQAKNYRNDTTDTGSEMHETDTVQKNEMEHVSEEHIAQSLSEEQTHPSTGELPLDKNFGSDASENRDSNKDKSGDTNFSSEHSTELTSHINEESSPPVRAETRFDQDECTLEQNHVSEEHVAQSLSQEEKSPSPGELLMHKNFGSDQSEIRDSCNEKSGDTMFSGEHSTEVTGHINDELSPPARAETRFDQDECSLEQNHGGDQNQSGDYHAKRPEGVSFSNEVASSELNHHDSEELSSPVAGDHSEEDWKQKIEMNENEHGYCNGKQLDGANFFDGVASSSELNHHQSEESSLAGVYGEEDDSRNCLEQNNGRNQTEFGDHEREWPGSIKFSDEFSSSTEVTCQEFEESSLVIGTSTELDENFESHSIFGRLSEESLMDSTITAQRPLNESNLMDSQISPHSEQLEQSQERALSGFDRVSSEDALEDSALPKRSPQYSLQSRDLNKYPTTGSYSAYNDSVSSYDGNDDQVPYHRQHLLEGKFEAERASAKAMHIQDEFELQKEARNCFLISSQQKHYPMKGSNCCGDELVESSRRGHPVRSRMKSEIDEPFCSRGYRIGSENDSPTNYGRNVSQSSTSFDSTYKSRHPEEEKMELLKMVCELQDQLNRSRRIKSRGEGRFTGVIGMEKQNPSYYGHLAPELGPHHDLNNTRHYQRRTSPIPFSLEPTISTHQVDWACFHRCSQDCNCSAPLPPQIWCKESQYTGLPRQKYHNIYPSTSSSPQHYTGSEFSLRSCDAKSDDHWHANHHEGKIFSWERHQPVKRHVLPVAGGAPFLICYRCSELLQLPADFLLFGRRFHRLRCSACSVILKFSLQNGSHILPYTEISPYSLAPPPCNTPSKLASVSYTGYSPNVDPVSCSDDCGPSLRQSCSTEEEPFSNALSFSALNRESSSDRKMSSGSSFEHMEERKKQHIFKESQNEYENPVKLGGSASSSLKRSIADKLLSEFKGSPRKSGSPLHKLFGYSSPSQVLDSW